MENEPDDRFVYQITFQIGKKSRSDFDSPVFCVLYGQRGKSRPIALVDGIRRVCLIFTSVNFNIQLTYMTVYLLSCLQLFEPNKSTNLTVTFKEDIGSVTHIHVWMMAEKEKDSLFLEAIIVKEPETQKM